MQAQTYSKTIDNISGGKTWSILVGQEEIEIIWNLLEDVLTVESRKNYIQ
jgi:hypothetical protein